MLRTDVINYTIEKMKYKSYLEIGVSDGNNFRQIKCDKKTSVDPVKICDDVMFEMTSDDFFNQNTEKFDIIFIDGHHHCEYVCRDINNSLKVLNKNGTIFVHDCFPHFKQASSRIDQFVEGNPWCGDGFKVIHSIVKNYQDYVNCMVLKTDWGIAMISKIDFNHKDILFDPSYTWEQMIADPMNEINLVGLNLLFTNLNEKLKK